MICERRDGDEQMVMSREALNRFDFAAAKTHADSAAGYYTTAGASKETQIKAIREDIASAEAKSLRHLQV